MEQQRWIKASAATLSSELQTAVSLEEFGHCLVSRCVPLLGGGVAGFYVQEEKSDRLSRVAAYGLADSGPSMDSFRLGEGLVGQCAQEGKTLKIENLPPDYLRIPSGLGGSVPTQVRGVPLLSKDGVLGVLELATFHDLSESEETLLEELLPLATLNLEILLRNLRTQNLLLQTQEQARQLEEQTEELTQSQEELLAQQRELTAQREQLQISEERTRLILESSSEGIFGVDIEGQIGFVNPAACRLLGFTAEELIGKPSHQLIHHSRKPGPGQRL